MFLTGEAASVDRERPVVFYCRVGSRSTMAAEAFRTAGYEVDLRLDLSADDLLQVIKGANARAYAAPATELLMTLITAAIIAYVGWRSMHGHMTPGAFIAFVGALGLASQSLRQLANLAEDRKAA